MCICEDRLFRIPISLFCQAGLGELHCCLRSSFFAVFGGVFLIKLEGAILIALCGQVLDSYSVITSYCPITNGETWHSLESSYQPFDSGGNNEYL